MPCAPPPILSWRLNSAPARVTPQGVLEADIGLAGGAIAALAPGLSGSAPEELDARGLHVFPGVIDAHVHFNEPGRAHWEGLETGSRALAAGGGTLFSRKSRPQW